MTGFNNDSKFVPSTPKTYTVLELRDQEVKKSPLSLAARSKVVNRSGSNYVSESESYGPCYVCEENKPTVWKDLYLSCPGFDENNNRPCSNTTKTYWCHATDGGTSEISNRAHIRCRSCYTDYHMSYWRFSCSLHQGDYWSTKRSTFRDSLQVVMKLSHYGEMIDDLIAYMSSHKNEARSGW